MVAQQTAPLYKSFDEMSVYDRNSITRVIDTAKQVQNVTADWDFQNQWKSQLTPEFNAQIMTDIQTYRQNAENERKIELENLRQRNNVKWDRFNINGYSEIKEQPEERYTNKKIGKQGYKWLRNFKATNGNWYAEYQPVRGGEGRKFYNLATEDWDDSAYVMSFQCQACNHMFRGIAPIAGNVCPQCGADSSRLRYRGRYS